MIMGNVNHSVPLYGSMIGLLSFFGTLSLLLLIG